MIKTKGLTHLNLTVRDVQKSIDFYQKAFGMEVQSWAGDKIAFLNTPGASDILTLQQVTAEEAVGPGGGVTHFGFVVQDKKELDTALREVETAGGTFVNGGEHAPGEPYAFVTDSDGYLFEVFALSG